jgi:membrane fusion protein (multidrug efflux system)
MKGRMMHRLRKHEPNYTKSIGYVKSVYKDNDFVKKGDTLFTIDKKDYQLKLMKQQRTSLQQKAI